MSGTIVQHKYINGMTIDELYQDGTEQELASSINCLITKLQVKGQKLRLFNRDNEHLLFLSKCKNGEIVCHVRNMKDE